MKRNLLLVFALMFFTHIAVAQKPLAWYNHTQLNVKNIDTSLAFYTKVFELDTILCPFPSTAKKRVKWLNAGTNIQIHMIENVGDTLHIVPDGHLGFSVRSWQEIKERLLKYSYGYQTGKLKIIFDGKMPYGAKMALFQDPDGNIVHVIEDSH
jgi:lactoylglutathione lyase